MSSNMIRRVSVAAVAIPTAIVVVYTGGWALAGLLSVFAGLGAAEVFKLAERAGIRPLKELGYVGAAAIPVTVFAASADGLGLDYQYILFAAPVFVIAVMAHAVFKRSPEEKPLAAVSITVFAVIYTSGLLAFLILLRHPPVPLTAWGATWLVFLPLTVVWVCDSMAMTFGSMIGGPKFAPVVSPNKTWSGTIAGSVSGGVVAPIYFWIFLNRFPFDLSLPQLIVFGVVVSSVGQVGDLAESLFKREVGTKDSGTFFPGHGGILDRFDSLYWAIPTAALLLRIYGVI
ncbi:MAG: phosphatidate cytidylyltransferase [Gemmatimonadota bacterium]|nr:MAG: phosphatidate cytidylyltransferase [Gemmatimonadota bacterium]